MGIGCSAWATTIGLNFVGGRSAEGGDGSGGLRGEALAPDDVAGLLPHENWNNGFGANSAGPAPATGPVDLVDRNGMRTGAVATWSGVPTTWTISSAAAADANGRLMNGYLTTNNSAGSTTITITDVPYAHYDVVIYKDDDAGAARSGDYTVNGVTQTDLREPPNWPVTTAGGGTFTQAVSGAAGNYALFSSVSGARLTINADESASGGGFRAPVNGLQIVDVGAYANEVLADNPTAYYRFQETAGTTAVDSIGGNNGTYVGAADRGVAGPRPPEYRAFNEINSATGFDGASAAVNTPVSLDNLAQFTLEGWVKADATPQANRSGLFGQNDVIEFGYINDATIELWTPMTGAHQIAAPADDVWFHLAAVGTGIETQLYIDGSLVSAQPHTAVASYGSSGFTANIGGGDVFGSLGNFFLGQIDDVAFYDRSLSAAEIFAHANIGQTMIDWNNAGGGSYLVGTNWVGAVVPSASQTARFNLDVTYSVTFSTLPASSAGLLVNDGLVTFSTTGTSGSPAYTIADDATISGGDLTISRGPLSPALTVEVGGALSVNGGSTLRVVSGSDLDTGSLSIADGGTIDVIGAGSTFDVLGTSPALIGTMGAGTLNISGGGSVSSAGTGINSGPRLGDTAGATGTAAVSGTGSSWSNSGNLTVGNAGAGTLTIQDGGTVSNDAGRIGVMSGSSGEVTVSGAGSTWTNSGGLSVGGSSASAGGTGALTVGVGGTVNVAATTKIWDDGTINLVGGTINTGALEFAGSTFNFTFGTLNISGTQAIDSAFLAEVLGPAQTIPTGKNLLVGGVMTLTEPVTLDGGSLSVGQLAGAPLLDLKRGSFSLTDQAVTVEAGGLFGERLQLKPEIIVNIDEGTTNSGLIYGNGILGGPLNNASAGEIRAEAGHTLTFTGAVADNSGDVRMLGGIVDFHGTLTNTASGRITGRGTLIARAGLANQGHIALSAGITDVYGDVINETGDPAVGITVSGNADATFWGDVTNTSGLFQVSPGSSATFFGGFAGSGISGAGDVYLEADITPGSSPGLAEFGGNIHLGPLANLDIELAGTTRGAAFDALDITGTAALDGTLNVSLLGSFTPAAGDVFEIITAAGGISGAFADVILPALTGNLFWNINYGASSVALEVAAPGLTGDYNNDGKVDAADYVVWRKNDINGQQGYNDWRANFGRTAGSGSGTSANAAVPEPANLVLVVFVAVGLGLQRGRAA